MEALLSDLPYRLVGALGGAVVALAMSNDAKSWSGLRKRFYVSMVFGLFLADPIADWMKWDMTLPRRIVAASCTASMLGWWIMHALIRVVQAYRRG